MAYEGKRELYEVTLESVAEGNEGSDGQVPCKSLMGDSTMEFLLGIINNDQVELLKKLKKQ